MNKLLTVLGIMAGAGVLFWGVPYYIDIQVEQRIAELAEGREKAPVIVELEKADAVFAETLENIEASQVRIEMEVDAFSTAFLAYLERQAN